MAPQTNIPVAANVLGTIGTSKSFALEVTRDSRTDMFLVLWCVQLIPQIWTNWKTKSTEGLPGSMLMCWALCAVPFGAYAIAQNFNIPLQLQPQALCTLSLINWGQTLVYHSKWRTWTAILLTTVLAILCALIECVLVFTLRPLYEQGVTFPMTILGIIASVLLGVGLLFPYLEIWKRRGRVLGINWLFLATDWMGAFFSLMALVAQHTFDVLGGVLYIVCMSLELGIAISHLIWLLRTHHIRKEARAAGKTFDEVREEALLNDEAFPFAERNFAFSKSKREQNAEMERQRKKEKAMDGVIIIGEAPQPLMR